MDEQQKEKLCIRLDQLKAALAGAVQLEKYEEAKEIRSQIDVIEAMLVDEIISQGIPVEPPEESRSESESEGEDVVEDPQLRENLRDLDTTSAPPPMSPGMHVVGGPRSQRQPCCRGAARKIPHTSECEAGLFDARAFECYVLEAVAELINGTGRATSILQTIRATIESGSTDKTKEFYYALDVVMGMLVPPSLNYHASTMVGREMFRVLPQSKDIPSLRATCGVAGALTEQGISPELAYNTAKVLVEKEFVSDG